MMISIENSVGPPDLHRGLEDRVATPLAARVMLLPCSASRRKTFSTTITAPSTMMPKSIAPSDSRLAGMPMNVRPRKVPSSASGMMSATIASCAEVAQEQVQHERHEQRAFDAGCVNTVLSVLSISQVRS